ncbi:MAG: hypothetical protein PF485_12240 [Bacteroidales bacterium]|jgi:hypothetical protein|nr:hypothetical protein [Bacteroidales bacterium]
MNNKKINTDNYTKELISKGGIQQPSSDFTKNVMSRILKNPAINIRFITNDDKKSNIWLLISLSILVIGFFIFYFIKYRFDFSNISEGIHTPSFLHTFGDLFSKLWNEISLSPYILIALVGVLLLVIIDKTIVKYLYSI